MSLDLFSENDKIIVKQIIDFFFKNNFFNDEKNFKLKNVPIVILGNKIDKKEACTEEELR
jgi:hypothetical protein